MTTITDTTTTEEAPMMTVTDANGNVTTEETYTTEQMLAMMDEMFKGQHGEDPMGDAPEIEDNHVYEENDGGTDLFEVIYMNDGHKGEGEVLMRCGLKGAAEDLMHHCWDTMHEENAADVIMQPFGTQAKRLAKQKEEELSTTTEDTTMDTNTTTQLAVSEVNKSALVSTIGAELFQNGLTPMDAMRVAAAWVGSVDHLEDMEMFLEVLVDGLEITEVDLRVDNAPVPVELEEINMDAALQALMDAGYLVLDEANTCQMGERFAELCALRTEAYRPAPAEEGITRRFGYAPTKYSNLFKEAVHALEATEYTRDDYMFSVAKEVVANMGGMDNDKEGYVLRGTDLMDSTVAYVSEFKGDRRLRIYQASCHGPNGQASDRSRALMDLFGVPMDYDVDAVMPIIKHEMADMVTVDDAKVRAQLVKDAVNDPVAFVIKHLTLKEDESQETIVSKPYSFVKAARVLVALHKGERPYIGMAVGLDAKCSGPQLGALMCGDQAIAAACGFTLVQLHDAYHRAVVECEKAGFLGLTRAEIKKPFMGIFYGQSFGAFMQQDQMTPELWVIIHGKGDDWMGAAGDEDNAKRFHKAVSASFGMAMTAVRMRIKAYSDKINGKITHYMPDGSLVAMNYKQKVNILGEAVVSNQTVCPDVVLSNNAESYKFINFKANTQHVHCGDFARNGFVNLIQATDAMLARLIIVHLKRMGAKHIICVHDCFRVNVTEMHLLEAAIIKAYSDLFGNPKNSRTEDLPMGTDILALYFEGANKVLMDGEKPTMVTQFLKSGSRRMPKINGESVSSLIHKLGQTYYFAK